MFASVPGLCILVILRKRLIICSLNDESLYIVIGFSSCYFLPIKLFHFNSFL